LWLASLELSVLAATVVVAVATVTVVVAVAAITVVVAVATITVVVAVAALAVVAAVATIAVVVALAIAITAGAELAALTVVLTGLTGRGGLSIVELEVPLTELGTLELLQSLNGRVDIDKVGVGKATRPASGTINSDTDVLETVDADEDVVQLGISGLVGDVADEKAGGRLVIGGAAGLLTAGLDADAAAVPERTVDLGTGLLEGLAGSKGNETETLAQAAGITGKENVGDLAELLEGALKVLLGSIEDDVADESGASVTTGRGLLSSSLLGSSRGSLGLLSLLGLLGLGSLLGVQGTGGLGEEADSLDSAGDKSSAGNAGGEGGSGSLGRDGSRGRESSSKSGTTDGLHFEELG